MIQNSKEVVSILGLIDTYRRWANNRDKDLRSYNSYHPSEWGKCLRKQQYNHYASLGFIKKKYEDFDSRILRLFDKGHNMHNRWVNYFEECGVLRGRWKCANPACKIFVDSGEMLKDMNHERVSVLISRNESRIYGGDNVKGIFRPERCVCGCIEFIYNEISVISDELNIRGHADLLIDCSRLVDEKFAEVRCSYNLEFLPKGEEIAVIDMKTIGSNSWRYQLERSGPHKEYVIQLVCYIHILDCAYGMLIYENKDNSEIKAYKIERNDKWWDIIKWQALTMEGMVKDKKLPPPKPSKKDCYECKGCGFKKTCHKSVVWSDSDLSRKRRGFYRELL